jgi:hypothetical protein
LFQGNQISQNVCVTDDLITKVAPRQLAKLVLKKLLRKIS